MSPVCLCMVLSNADVLRNSACPLHGNKSLDSLIERAVEPMQRIADRWKDEQFTSTPELQ